ncbi:MAG: tail fiber protein [Bacteroidetes bacterium]|nr:tail fiber protein [Bacteroidota bacterium]
MSASAGIPAGSIIAFAGDIGDPVSSPPGEQDYTTDPIPNNPVTDNIEGWGWMVCDGRQLYCCAYPQLFRVIGFLYSKSGDQYAPGYSGKLPPDATFRIPDYRGYFLRAVNGTALNIQGTAPNDPDAGSRTLKNGMTNAGVGSIQQDALQLHWHEYTDPTPTVATIGEEGSDSTLTTGSANTSPPTNATDPPEDTPNTVRTSTETRSKNMYVHYLIKYV